MPIVQFCLRFHLFIKGRCVNAICARTQCQICNLLYQNCTNGIVVLPPSSRTLNNANCAVSSQIPSLYRGPVCQCHLCMNTMPNMQSTVSELHKWHCGITAQFAHTQQCHLCIFISGSISFLKTSVSMPFVRGDNANCAVSVESV